MTTAWGIAIYMAASSSGIWVPPLKAAHTPASEPEYVNRQAGVGGGHIDLVVDAAGGEGAEGVEIHLLAGGGKAGADAGGVGLGDAASSARSG